MLEFMRRRARSTWIKVVFLIIVAVFIFWGVGGSVGGGGRADIVAKVDGRVISTREFQRAYENVKSAYREMYKDRLTPDMLEKLNLREQTLDQLIDARLLEAEARRLGFTVDDEEVRQTIAAMEVFQAHGSFGQEQYLRVLRYLRVTPGEFEDDQRAQLLSKKLQRLITDASQVTDDEVRDLFRLSREKVSLSFVKVASADLLAGITVESKEVEEFYNTHRESFRQPERVKFVYIAYPATQFESAVQVSAQEVADFYAEHKDDRFTTPARVQARHILFSLSSGATAEEKAKVRAAAADVLTRARAGEDFATLAKTYSQDTATAPKGGDLGFFTRGRMVKPFEEAAFNLPAGGISDLVESPFGLHIIKVEATEPEQVRPLAEVEEEIRQELTRTHARDRAQDRVREDRSKIQNGAALADVAQAAGLSVVETPLVGRDETIPDLGRQPTLIEAALAVAPQQASEPVAVADTWYLVSPREKVASTIPDFAAVAAEAEKRCKSEKAEQLAKEKADALLVRVKETKDPAAAAAEQKLTVEESGPFTRQGSYIPKMGSLPELKKAAFRLTSDAPVVPQTYLWGGNAFVAVLKEQIPPDLQDFEKQKDTIREQLLKRQQEAAMEELVRYLKKRATITYNQDALLKTPS
ncbi:MAG: SurA N-terminal domain-containing protein [Deltaproteobacteria bacterium]|nr:SurA N-terminal domain-containing protein [Deltaproteobacteria bacterium]